MTGKGPECSFGPVGNNCRGGNTENAVGKPYGGQFQAGNFLFGGVHRAVVVVDVIHSNGDLRTGLVGPFQAGSVAGEVAFGQVRNAS